MSATACGLASATLPICTWRLSTTALARRWYSPATKQSHRSPIERSAMKLRAIIVDDEELARQILREYLGKAGEVEIVAECANGFEAVKAVGELRPDLLFLD